MTHTTEDVANKIIMDMVMEDTPAHAERASESIPCEGFACWKVL